MIYIIRLILLPYQVFRGASGVFLIELHTLIKGDCYTVECPDWVSRVMRYVPNFKSFYKKDSL